MKLLAMTEEQPRLYSKQPRLPVDVVAPEHAEIHADLERWGRWCRGSGGGADTCASLESRFESGGREVKQPTISLPPNPLHDRISRAVWRMTFQHGESLRLFYIKRRSPTTICGIMRLRYEDFPKWMGDARNMLLYILKHATDL